MLQNKSSQVASVDDDEWRRDFEASNNLASTVEVAESTKLVAANDDEELESVDLVASSAGSSAAFHVTTYTSPVKVSITCMPCIHYRSSMCSLFNLY